MSLGPITKPVSPKTKTVCTYCGTEQSKENAYRPCENCGASFHKVVMIRDDVRKTFSWDDRQQGPI